MLSLLLEAISSYLPVLSAGKGRHLLYLTRWRGGDLKLYLQISEGRADIFLFAYARRISTSLVSSFLPGLYVAHGGRSE